MPLQIKPFSFQSPSKGVSPDWRDRGYALLVVMMMAALLLISLTVALPSIYQEGRREREEELVFRGNEYARAIMLFNRQFRRYPASVKELLQTNGIRFLRREYTDPVSKTGKWRFVHAGPNGVVLDSKTMGPAGGMGAGGMGGGSQFGAPGGQGQSSFGGSQQFGSGGQSQSSSGSSQQFGSGGQAQSSFGSSQQPGATDESSEKKEESAFFGPSNQPMGSAIVGVASTSKKRSIRVLNGRTHYDEWEFLGVATGMGAMPGGMAPQPNQAIPSQRTTQPGTTPIPQTTPATQPPAPGPQPPESPDMPPLTDEPISEPEQ